MSAWVPAEMQLLRQLLVEHLLLVLLATALSMAATPSVVAILARFL